MEYEMWVSYTLRTSYYRLVSGSPIETLQTDEDWFMLSLLTTINPLEHNGYNL